MADTKITAATDITTLAATDAIPVGRPGNTIAYKATMTEVQTYVTNPMPITTVFGVEGSVEGGFEIATLGTGHFYNAVDQATFFGHPDDVYYWGYNRNGIATYPNAALHSMSMVVEADYYSGAATHWAEWYVEYRSAAAVVRRPFQTSINLATDAATNQLVGSLVLNASDGTLRWQMVESGPIYSYGHAITFETNGVNCIRQKNAAGSGYKDILLNAADQWAFGTDILVYGNAWFHLNNTYGPVLLDQSDGHVYKIQVTAGVLGTTQLW